MRQCRICHFLDNHQSFQVREMQHCTKEIFEYFQCSNCRCIQIAEIPEDLERHYPSDYYSFSENNGNNYLDKRADFIHRKELTHFIENKVSRYGTLFPIRYLPPTLFDWIKRLKPRKKDRILDIGCGSGILLKQLWHYGFDHVLGIDPFISEDLHFSDKVSVLKQDPLRFAPEQTFDIIMLHHSLEHMPDHDAIFQKINSLLSPGGKVLIRIPIVSEALMQRFGTNLFSWDAPRHFVIHSPKSMELLASRNGFEITDVNYDSDSLSIWASEQYQRDICLHAENSFDTSQENSIFKKEEIKNFIREIDELNKTRKSDCAAFYLEKK